MTNENQAARAQRSDLIAAQRKVWGDAEQICECGRTCKPFSCYCEQCEAELYEGLDFAEIQDDQAVKAAREAKAHLEAAAAAVAKMASVAWTADKDRMAVVAEAKKIAIARMIADLQSAIEFETTPIAH